jgi:hypothetical protein
MGSPVSTSRTNPLIDDLSWALRIDRTTIELYMKCLINILCYRFSKNLQTSISMSVGLFKLLGHRSIKTTEIYANWVRKEELERWV